LLRRIGGGAYGEVWLARSATGVLRALKIVHRSTFEDDRPFQREFEGIQRFERISREHPGQLALFHIGRNEAEGYFYYVMELADDANAAVAADVRRLTSNSSEDARPHPGPLPQGEGERSPALGQVEARKNPATGARDSLSHRMGEGRGEGASSFVTRNSEFYVPKTLRSELAQGRLPAARVLEIGLALSEALGHLHGHGLVHRDVKPSNVIFVNGKPKLADIGLVTDASDTCSIVGTEGYLPPEGPGTPQADLFALGKVLYEAATGLDRRQLPLLPGDLRQWPDYRLVLELNEVVLKACAADPRHRYPSAEAMHADLELLNAGKSVKQRHSAARRWKFAKKAAIVAAVGTMFVAGVFSLQHSRQQPLDPLTTGKNVGGYPPTAMRGTTNTEAWNHYRLGYHAVRRGTDESDRQALDHFNRAIALDTKFALANFGLWRSKYPGVWRLTPAQSNDWQRLSDKLVELDPGLAETHVPLGFAHWREWKWREAEAEFREALRLNPDCLPAWVSLGFLLSFVGRTDESIEALNRGLLVDPNWAQLVKMKGHAYFVQRRYQKALDLYLESVRQEPLFPDARWWAARAYFALTNYPAAIEELEQYDLLQGRRAPDEVKQECADLRRAFQEGGVRGYWLKQLELTRARWKPDEYPYAFAQIHARLCDKDLALKFLEKARVQHDELVYLIFDECWDHWRDEPRFEAIRQQVGLPRHPSFPAK
jgi:serine/threonine protein kinase